MRAWALGVLFGSCMVIISGSLSSVAAYRKMVKSPQLTANPSSINFGSVDVGASVSQSLVLSNTGNADASINSVSTTNAAFGVTAPALPFVLKAGYSITLTVTFVASAAGSVNSTLGVAATGLPNLYISLAGTGIVLASTTSTSHHASLSWGASTSTVDGYNVYRSSASGGPYTRINATTLTVLTFDDTTVVAGQTYYYVVTATTAGVESTYSNEVQAVVPSP